MGEDGLNEDETARLKELAADWVAGATGDMCILTDGWGDSQQKRSAPSSCGRWKLFGPGGLGDE